MGKLINTNLTRLDVINYSNLVASNYNRSNLKYTYHLLLGLNIVLNRFNRKNFLWKMGFKIVNYNLSIDNNQLIVKITILTKDFTNGYYVKDFKLIRVIKKALTLIILKIIQRYSASILGKYKMRPNMNIVLNYFKPQELNASFLNKHLEAFLVARKGNPVKILRRFLKNLRSWFRVKVLRGYLIILKGRFGKRLRAKKMIFKRGITSFNKFSTLLDYDKRVLFTRYGNYSVKTWISKHKLIPWKNEYIETLLEGVQFLHVNSLFIKKYKRYNNFVKFNSEKKLGWNELKSIEKQKKRRIFKIFRLRKRFLVSKVRMKVEKKIIS